MDRVGVRLEAAVASHGGLVILSGGPGSGISSIAGKAAERAVGWGFEVLWGRCLKGTLGRPFAGLADALEAHALAMPQTQVAADLGADAGPILRLCPALTNVVPTFAPAVPLEAADERLRLHEAVASWLGRMSSRSQLLVVIDGIADAGGDLIELLRHVARGIRSRPILVLLCGLAPAELTDVALDTIELPGLDDGAVAALLGDLDGRVVPSQATALIHEVSGGVPLVAIELFRHFCEEEFLPEFGAPHLPQADALPHTLEEIEAWRISAGAGDAGLSERRRGLS